MVYQVKKDGLIFMQTEDEKCRYTPQTEAALQEAGYDIYIDGKRLKKIKPAGGRRSGDA